MKRVIGITGLKGSGKSTVASFLVREGFVRTSFAAPIKEMLRTLGLTTAQLSGDQKEVPSVLLMGKTPRWAMQTLGTEWGRNCISPTFWSSLWSIRTRAMLDEGLRVVVDDVRFDSEVNAVILASGEVWRIERPGLAPDGHASEAHIAELSVDWTIVNDGTLEELEHTVKDLLIA